MVERAAELLLASRALCFDQSPGSPSLLCAARCKALLGTCLQRRGVYSQDGPVGRLAHTWNLLSRDKTDNSDSPSAGAHPSESTMGELLGPPEGSNCALGWQ